MSTLYEMTQQAQNLYEMLQAEEIDEQVFSDTLEAIGVGEKIESYCKVIKQFEAETDLYANEMKRLAARKKVAERNIDRLKEALLQYLTATGQSKATGGTFLVSTAKSVSVEVLNEDVIPIEYLKPQAPKVDKAKIKEELKAGLIIPGVNLVTKEGVRIR